MKAYLALEDGTLLEGKGFGSPCKAEGELVFGTGMSGYVEALTDPSYNGQLLMFTYPLIGNYGVSSEDFQSDGIKCEGAVVKDICKCPSNWRSEKTLDEFLKEEEIPGIEGIDTRMLTRKARVHGTMKAVLSNGDADKEGLVEEAKSLPSIKEIPDLVNDVSTDKMISHKNDNDEKMVLIDCGYKESIAKHLLDRGSDVDIVPHDTPSDEILDLNPDGVLVSNGPGNPEILESTIKTVNDLIGETPLFGICLGHQIISLACGGQSFKLKYGHRGINQPVKDMKSGRVFISTQNHGFTIDKDSLNDTDLEISQINLNDDTIEGVENDYLSIKTVQYHPEAKPGPHDTYFFFEEMFKMISK